MPNQVDAFSKKYGPWAIVAGASEGIGAAFAMALAKKGLNLILLARRIDKLETLADKIRSTYPVDVILMNMDLGEPSEVDHMLENLNQEIGLLVYNAAFSPIGNFEDISEEDLSKITQVNIRTPLLMLKSVSKQMIARKKGGVILMSSLSGTQGSPKIATYAASKSFNTILAEGLWKELGSKGIDVMACCAGAVRTPGYLRSKSQKDAPGTLDPEEVADSALKALGKGPVVVPGFTNKVARFVMGRLLPRKTAISIMYKNTKDLK